MKKLFVIEKCNDAETGEMEFVAAFASEYAANAWAEAQGLQGRYAGSNGKWRTDYYECVGEFELDYSHQ